MPKNPKLYSQLKHAFDEGFRVWISKCDDCKNFFYSTFQDNTTPDPIECPTCRTMTAHISGEAYEGILKTI